MKSVLMAFRCKTTLILIILSILISCQQRPHLIVKRHRLLMGTLVEISVIGRDEDKTAAAIGDAFAEMERIEKLMSRRIPGSDVSRINGWRGGNPVKASGEVLKVIRRAGEISKASDGYFDISIGVLLDLWEFEDNGGHLPGKDEVGKALRSIRYGAIVVDEEASTVQFKGKGMQIDLGGVAKGYAVDRAFEVLKAMGYGNMIVNAGGDMRVGGRKPHGPWAIGIQNPRDRSRILATLDAEDISIATSGDYERYFEVDGIRYHHLLNPFTGFPARQCRSVTILAKDALSADALATAVFVMGPRKGLELIEELDGIEGLIVSADGAVFQSQGLRGKIRFPD